MTQLTRPATSNRRPSKDGIERSRPISWTLPKSPNRNTDSLSRGQFIELLVIVCAVAVLEWLIGQLPNLPVPPIAK